MIILTSVNTLAGNQIEHPREIWIRMTNDLTTNDRSYYYTGVLCLMNMYSEFYWMICENINDLFWIANRIIVSVQDNIYYEMRMNDTTHGH